jgi:hypothetical protein
MKLLTGLGIMAIVGLAVGIALFSLTSGHLGTLQTISPPPCPQVNADPTAFDPLTGLPYGYTFVCGGGRATFHQPLAAQQAIPVPLGFLLGAAAAGSVLLFDVGRRRWAGPAKT